MKSSPRTARPGGRRRGLAAAVTGVAMAGGLASDTSSDWYRRPRPSLLAAAGCALRAGLDGAVHPARDLGTLDLARRAGSRGAGSPSACLPRTSRSTSPGRGSSFAATPRGPPASRSSCAARHDRRADLARSAAQPPGRPAARALRGVGRFATALTAVTASRPRRSRQARPWRVVGSLRVGALDPPGPGLLTAAVRTGSAGVPATGGPLHTGLGAGGRGLERGWRVRARR